MGPAPLDNLGVLFIEDDPRISELYRLKLEADGYLVRIVKSDAAVGAAQAQRPEIIFPSVVLAASNGIELDWHGLGLSAADYVVRVP